MGIGIDTAKSLIAAVHADPSTARAELADAVTALQAIIFALDSAEQQARADFIAKALVEFEPQRLTALTNALASTEG
jgi:hypothetical protein